jgi:hypothetical protein
MPSSERLPKPRWSRSFALLVAGLELYRCGPLVTVVVPSHILQTSSKLAARLHPYQDCRVMRSCRVSGDERREGDHGYPWVPRLSVRCGRRVARPARTTRFAPG